MLHIKLDFRRIRELHPRSILIAEGVVEEHGYGFDFTVSLCSGSGRDSEHPPFLDMKPLEAIPGGYVHLYAL
jgi:hypothetical protein